MNRSDNDSLKMVSVMLLLAIIFMLFALMFDMQEKNKMTECVVICDRLNLSFQYLDGDRCVCEEGIGKMYYVDR